MVIQSVPYSDAKNAYDLVTDAAAAIVAEPRRVNMEFWKATGADLTEGRAPSGKPACGTVACAAGWIATLSGLPVAEDKFRGKKTTGLQSAGTVALNLLTGLRWNDYYSLDSSDDDRINYMRRDFDRMFGQTSEEYWGNATPGTQEYADRVAARMLELRDQYADTLKAATLAPLSERLETAAKTIAALPDKPKQWKVTRTRTVREVWWRTGPTEAAAIDNTDIAYPDRTLDVAGTDSPLVAELWD